MSQISNKKKPIELDGKTWTRYSISIWDIKKSPSESKLKHPAMFPEELARRLIEIYTRKGEVVLDPFLGSGTTLLAARNLDRKGLGFEISNEYVQLARKRLSQRLIVSEKEEMPIIYQEDARQLLKYLNPNSVDLVVTSPPYWDIHHQKRTADYKEIRPYTKSPMDLGNISDYSELIDALKDVFSKVYTVLKPNKWCIIILMDVRKLTDANVRLEEERRAIFTVIESLKNTVFWRNVRTILGKGLSYTEFEVPEMIMNASDNIKKEFLRGFADVAGSARYANRDEGGRCRIYLDVLNANWVLPVQICHLLQDSLNVPVRNITWGHPNIRDPKLVSYNKGQHGAWAREHQIRVYAENFLKIGFYMSHKQEILEELVEYNLKEFGEYESYCSPPKRKIRKKSKHPEESSKRLPTKLRGKHYDAYWQICCDLGCPRCVKQMALVKRRKRAKREKKT